LRVLAAALALVGNLDDVRNMMRQHLDLDPDCSVTTIKARFRYSERASQRYLDGLRKAGLPE
jgi:hypothetical protein